MKIFDLKNNQELTVNDGVAATMLSKGGYRPSLPLPGNEAPAKPAGLPAGPSAERLYKKAGELEARLDQLRDAVPAAERNLAASYAEDGGNPEAAGRRLMEARDQLSAAIAALGQLEKQAHERAKAERTHGEQSIYFDMHKEFFQTTPKVREGIAGALPRELASIVDSLASQAAAALWSLIQERGASRFVALHRVPAEPRPRDAQGFPINDAQIAEANDRRNRLGTTA